MLGSRSGVQIELPVLPISVSCCAPISVVDVILIWQGVLNDPVENLNPLLKASNVIFGDVSGTGALVKLNAAALFESGEFGKAPCAFLCCPWVDHVGTKINISG